MLRLAALAAVAALSLGCFGLVINRETTVHHHWPDSETSERGFAKKTFLWDPNDFGLICCAGFWYSALFMLISGRV